MEKDWRGIRVVVTGGTGFLGRHLCAALEQRGAKVTSLSSKDCDLRYITQIVPVMRGLLPEVIFHLAARVGGIEANRIAPADMIYDNLTMGLNLCQCVAHHMTRRPKIVMASSVCAYPETIRQPMAEGDLWNGYPEQTNAAYGIAKRTMHTVLGAYYDQYAMSSAYVLLANLYGPGDDFKSRDGHVIPALIRRIDNAIRNESPGVTIWGSGAAMRDFLYVEDAARALVLAAEKAIAPQHPINVGTGVETSIATLAETLCRLLGFEGQIAYDRSRPDGQQRRQLDISRAGSFLAFQPRIGLEDGLARTIDWYRNEYPIMLKEASCGA